MRVRGRRHWTETITLQSVTSVTSGPNTGATTVATVASGVQASVQPLNNAERLQHGLTTDSPAFWTRYVGQALLIGDNVVWRSQDHRVVSVSEGNNIDVELLIEPHELLAAPEPPDDEPPTEPEPPGDTP